MKRLYECYLKSHYDGPDCEMEVEAETFNDAALHFFNNCREQDLSYIVESTRCADEPIDCSACREYQNLKIASGCPAHKWQKTT